MDNARASQPRTHASLKGTRAAAEPIAAPAAAEPIAAPAAAEPIGAPAAADNARVADAGLRRQIGALLPELRAFARFLARDRTMADDLVQDAVMRALAALHQFQPGTSLKAWLFTILRNSFYQQQRSRRRESVAISASFDLSETASPVQDAHAEINDLQQLIFKLPPLLREALILVGAQELSHEEAALVCNVPVGTMKARLSRARVALSAAVRSAEQSG